MMIRKPEETAQDKAIALIDDYLQQFGGHVKNVTLNARDAIVPHGVLRAQIFFGSGF